MSAQLNRLLTLIPYLQANPGVPVVDVARDLDCTIPELLEELQQLIMCGVPPYLPNDYISVFIEDGGIEVRFAQQFDRPIGFTVMELACLTLMLRQAADEAGDDTRATIESLLARLESVVTPIDAPDSGTGGETRQLALATPPPRARAHAVALEKAAGEHRRVRITHYSVARDALVTREVEPYALVERGGRLYLWAHDSLRDKVVAFRVDRIRDADPLDETFAPPAREFLDELAQRSVRPSRRKGERFAIRFAPRAARFLREGWDKRYFTDEADGSVVFRAPLLSDNWALSFALSYGEAAEVLEPPRLREAMADRLANIHAALEVGA